MSSDDLDALNTPIEGEVVEPRRRERNEGRSAEILPPDVESKVTALRTLGGESQARSVTVMLNHARTGLLTAIAAQDLPGIVEYKQKAHAITEISKQLRVGKELQLDAAEFLRRAERGLGVAIREGQARGDIRNQGETTRFESDVVDQDNKKSSPTDFAKRTELSGNEANGRMGIYHLTDGVSDEQFTEAIDEAKAEGNLSRANVARKAKAKAKPVISEDDPLLDAEVEPKPAVGDVISPERIDEIKKPKPKTGKQDGPKADSTEMLERIEGMFAAIAQTCKYIDPSDIDPAKRVLVNQIRHHIGTVRKTLKEIEHA